MNNTMTRSACVGAALLLSITAASAAEMLTSKEGDALTEGWTMAKRTDGTMQLAFDGKPTYLFEGDAKKGDITGDGVGGVWHIIKG